MITDPQVSAYLRTLEQGNGEFLDALQQYARENHIPIIKEETASLIKVLLSMHKPTKILEVGTAIGYSAILMTQYMNEGKIITIERNQKRYEQAKENIAKMNLVNKIEILFGDAGEILKSLNEEFDFIFMDAAKGQYLDFLPDCLRLLSNQGILVSDNVLQDGDVSKSRFAITRRNRTIHNRMRAYLREIKMHPGLESTVLPVGDGVTISYKKDLTR